jgi:hypothetical protein
MVLRKDTEHLFGQMEVDMMASLKITIFKDLGITYGLMEDNMKEYGKTIK